MQKEIIIFSGYNQRAVIAFLRYLAIYQENRSRIRINCLQILVMVEIGGRVFRQVMNIC